jgi:all-trans-retinol dehydrogenase (NAD+)
MTQLAAKNVLITGAASGIGRLLTEKIAAEQAHVILWDIDGPGLKELSEGLKLQGYRVSSYRCDVSDRESVYSRAARILEAHGGIDVLINNAGIVTGKPLLEASDEEIERTFRINTLALFWTTRAFLPTMMERNGGHIVTIASAGGLVGAPRLIDYSASKFAAVGFDEALRLELKHQGARIRTTVVCPYYVNTGMFEGVKTRLSVFLPILKQEYVANKIVKAIKKNQKRLIMPRFIYVSPLMRVLPTDWFDGLVGFFGVSRSMDEFTGRRLESGGTGEQASKETR